MVKLQVILGSTRPGRAGEGVAVWANEVAKKRSDLTTELVDVAEYNLPLLDEPLPPMMHQYTKDHTKKWSAKINEADAYLIVTAEYDHTIPAALSNAIQYLNVEWNNKAVGFVGYGSAEGVRAVEHLRQVAAEVHMADIREQLRLSLGRDFEGMKTFQPTEAHEQQLNKVLNGLVLWGEAMQAVRAKLAGK